VDRGLRADQLDAECDCDPSSYLVLQGKQIARVAGKPLGPMRIGLGID